MEKATFEIVDWHGKTHTMTAGQLLARIRQDASKNNHNHYWLASPDEIIKTATSYFFPEEVANELKVLILNNCAETFVNELDNIEDSNNLTVAYCYYSSHGKKAKKVKQLYKENYLKFMTRYWTLKWGATIGEKWSSWHDAWIEDASKHFIKYFGNDIILCKSKIEEKYKKDLYDTKASKLFAREFEEHRKAIQELSNAIKYGGAFR